MDTGVARIVAGRDLGLDEEADGAVRLADQAQAGTPQTLLMSSCAPIFDFIMVSGTSTSLLRILTTLSRSLRPLLRATFSLSGANGLADLHRILFAGDDSAADRPRACFGSAGSHIHLVPCQQTSLPSR